MGENVKSGVNKLYKIDPDGTETLLGEVGEPLELAAFEPAGGINVGTKPSEATLTLEGAISWEKASDPDWDKILMAAFARLFTRFIMYKYSRVVHFMRHGKTERVRKKNSRRLDRMITKEINKYARMV